MPPQFYEGHFDFRLSDYILQDDVGNTSQETEEAVTVENAACLSLVNISSLLDLNSVDADPQSNYLNLSYTN